MTVKCPNFWLALGIIVTPTFFFLNGVGVAATEAKPDKKSLNFSGHVWLVKASTSRVGPGTNYFSDSRDNVWVDATGRLHLRICEREGKWYCAEIISKESFGLGTYRFTLDTPLVKVDRNIVLGLFTWSDSAEFAHREIDVECGKWGNESDVNNAQFVVQPYQVPGRLIRFTVPAELSNVTYGFLWRDRQVRFQCGESGNAHESILKEWNFKASAVPRAGSEHARINLWLCTSKPPYDKNATEVIISAFTFKQPSSSGE